jgi:hypothetical protein
MELNLFTQSHAASPAASCDVNDIILLLVVRRPLPHVSRNLRKADPWGKKEPGDIGGSIAAEDHTEDSPACMAIV